MLSGDLTLGSLVILTVATYGGLAVFALFVGFERRGRPELVIAVLLGAVLAQLAVYSADHRVPTGPFRPGPLRLPELLIIAAVGARLWTRGFGARVSATGLAWALVVIWYVASFASGIWEGHGHITALFHTKFAVYAGGGYLLASGLPVARLVTVHALGRWLGWLGAFVAVQTVVTLTGADGALGPLTPVEIGADSASVYFAIGVAVLLVEATREHARSWVWLSMCPLLVAPFAASQRASVVHVVATAVVVVVTALGSTWPRRVRVRPTQAVLVAMAMVAAVVVLLLPRISQGEAVPPVVEETLDETFGGPGNVYSADARVLKWEDARARFAESPLVGNGMGVTFVSFHPGKQGVGVFEKAEVYDSLPMDLLVRTGVIGLLLLVIALAMSMRDGWRVWRRHPDRHVAALALGAVVYLVGFLAKGAVESVQDKITLACLVGLATGVIASAASQLTSAAPMADDSRSIDRAVV